MKLRTAIVAAAGTTSVAALVYLAGGLMREARAEELEARFSIPSIERDLAWVDATAERPAWSDQDWVDMLAAVDSLPARGAHAVMAIEAHVTDREWPLVRRWAEDLHLHPDEFVRCAALTMLANRGADYGVFRGDRSGYVGATLHWAEHGELPPGYDMD